MFTNNPYFKYIYLIFLNPLKIKFIAIRENKADNFERRRISTTSSNEIGKFNRPKKFSFANEDLNNFRDSAVLDNKKFNIVINKNILEQNAERETVKLEAPEEERNYFQSGKKERKPMTISACNSLVNSTRNLNNLNKQFDFSNEVIHDAANLMNNINEANYSYGSKQGRKFDIKLQCVFKNIADETIKYYMHPSFLFLC